LDLPANQVLDGRRSPFWVKNPGTICEKLSTNGYAWLQIPTLFYG
jgi:hypothetical protein